MKVFVVGKVNQNTGNFYYFHMFTGEKQDRNAVLIVDRTVLFFSEGNEETISTVYNGMYGHREQDAQTWFESLITRVFNGQTFGEGDWYSNI